MRLIYYIPDLFFFKYSLLKISLLKPVFNIIKLFSLIFTIVIFVCHINDDLIKDKKCNIDIAEYISDFIT